MRPKDVRAGTGIEVAGGLIGKQQRGFADQGAGQHDALLFAAGELAGAVSGAGFRPTSLNLELWLRHGRGCSRISSGIITFSSAVNSGSR